jgi:hypothetical protein
VRLDSRQAIEKWIDGAGLGTEGIVFYDPPDIFDAAIVGVARRFNSYFVVYDMATVIANLAEDIGDEEGALEHFGYNVVGAWLGEGTAAFLTVEDEAEVMA